MVEFQEQNQSVPGTSQRRYRWDVNSPNGPDLTREPWKNPGISRVGARPAGRNKAQAAEWTRDRRVTVHSRPLRYPRDWPNEPAREKGVDVALAIALVRAAIEKTADTLILASRDTDLLPALEAARTIGGAIVEVAGWEGDSRLRFGGAQNGHRLWSTCLKEEHYRDCRDLRQDGALKAVR